MCVESITRFFVKTPARYSRRRAEDEWGCLITALPSSSPFGNFWFRALWMTSIDKTRWQRDWALKVNLATLYTNKSHRNDNSRWLLAYFCPYATVKFEIIQKHFQHYRGISSYQVPLLRHVFKKYDKISVYLSSTAFCHHCHNTIQTVPGALLVF